MFKSPFLVGARKNRTDVLPSERIAYCARVFKPAKAAKRGAIFATSGNPTKRIGAM
jgi:hypothetical protein